MQSEKIYLEFQEKVIKIVGDVLEIERSSLELDSNIERYITNSIDFVKVIIEIEDAMEFDFNKEELKIDRFKTIRHLVDSVFEKVR